VREKIIRKSHYAIISGRGNITGYGLFLKDNLFLVPSHYVVSWRDTYHREMIKDSESDIQMLCRLRNFSTGDEILLDCVDALKTAIVDSVYDIAII
jgi:hypothetical protein